MAQLLLFNKPFNVLTQFRTTDNVTTLKDYISIPDVYPAGRLDKDSEGLLLLTDSGYLQHLISDPKHKLVKTYWVQVENIPEETALHAIRTGIILKDGKTKPAQVKLIAPPSVWSRQPPIRERKAIPTQWLEIKITEGKNRQVRRMTAAVGHPTLRLIRYAIGDWTVENLQPGQWQAVDATSMIKSGHDLETKNNRRRSDRTESTLSGRRRIHRRQAHAKPTSGSPGRRRKPD